MSNTLFREQPPGTKRVYQRVDPDMTDVELQVWAEAFVDAALGDPGGDDNGSDDTRT